MDDKEKYNQPTVDYVDPAEENKDILASISLSKARYYLNEHNNKEDGVNDLE